MNTHENQDELLARVLSGELDSNSAEYREAARRDPALAGRLLELRRAQTGLQDMAREAEELVELARGAATPHERALVRRVLAARLPAHPPPPGIVRRRFPRTWAVAAGLLLVAAGALFFARRAEHPESGLLDHSPPLVALPLETGVRVQLGAAPRGGEYLVAVFAAGAPEGEALLRTRTREETWNLPADLADAWRSGRRLRIVVEARDELSQPVGVPRSLELSPP